MASLECGDHENEGLEVKCEDSSSVVAAAESFLDYVTNDVINSLVEKTEQRINSFTQNSCSSSKIEIPKSEPRRSYAIKAADDAIDDERSLSVLESSSESDEKSLFDVCDSNSTFGCTSSDVDEKEMLGEIVKQAEESAHRAGFTDRPVYVVVNLIHNEGKLTIIQDHRSRSTFACTLIVDLLFVWGN